MNEGVKKSHLAAVNKLLVSGRVRLPPAEARLAGRAYDHWMDALTYLVEQCAWRPKVNEPESTFAKLNRCRPICAACQRPVQRFEVTTSITEPRPLITVWCHGAAESVRLTKEQEFLLGGAHIWVFDDTDKIVENEKLRAECAGWERLVAQHEVSIKHLRTRSELATRLETENNALAAQVARLERQLNEARTRSATDGK